MARDETAGIVIDVSSLVSVGEQGVGRKCARDLAEGIQGRAKAAKQLLVHEAGAIRLAQPLERAVGNVGEGASASGFLKANVGIFFEAAEFALETVIGRSAVGGEDDQRCVHALEQAAA